MHEMEGASDSGAPSIKLTTPDSSTDNDSAEENVPAPPVLQKPQRPLYDTSADSTPVPTPDTSRPTTPAHSQLVTGKARPLGGKMSRSDKKKANAFNSAPVSSGDEASTKRKGKGSAKKGRVWGEFGAEEEDDSVLDYSQTEIRDESTHEQLADINPDSWGHKTKKGEFILKDLDDEMDAIIAEQNAKKEKNTANAPSGLVGSSLGAIGGLFRNVVGGKTLTKEDLAKPLKGMEDHLLRKNVAREAAVRLCESVERDLVGMKTPSFTSEYPFSSRTWLIIDNQQQSKPHSNPPWRKPSLRFLLPHRHSISCTKSSTLIPHLQDPTSSQSLASTASASPPISPKSPSSCSKITIASSSLQQIPFVPAR